MSGNQKINLSSVVDMKLNCDEKLADVLGYDYREDYTIVDTKLILTYASVGMAAGAFYLDRVYKNDFKLTVYYQTTVNLVVAFYVLTAASYAFSKAVEKNTKFVGVDAQNNKVSIASELVEYDPVYHIKVTYNGKSANTEIPFTSLYNRDGYLQLDMFKKSIAEQITLLKKAKA